MLARLAIALDFEDHDVHAIFEKLIDKELGSSPARHRHGVDLTDDVTIVEPNRFEEVGFALDTDHVAGDRSEA